MSADHDGDSHMASSDSDSYSDADLPTPSTSQTIHPTSSINTRSSASAATTAASSILSPPDSQHRDQPPSHLTMPIPSGANANGKRPIQTISNGSGGGGDDQEGPSVESFDIDSSLGEEDTELGRTAAAMALSNNSNSTGNGAAAAASGKKKNEFAAKTHQPSGYTWSRTEDEPGYAWTNKKAVDESARAWEGLSFREGMVNNRYGDPFEVAERERAMLNSLQQR